MEGLFSLKTDLWAVFIALLPHDTNRVIDINTHRNLYKTNDHFLVPYLYCFIVTT